MYQLRIYTIATKVAAKAYATTCWDKHVKSLAQFGIHTESVFLERPSAEQTRVVALVRYNGTKDLAEVNAEYMNSAAFREDMQGFDMRAILRVEEITLDKIR